MNSHELQERLIAFSTSVIKITETLASTTAGKNLSNQLVRSATSVSLNYGEAQSGESRKDFVHKLRIVLKELRETYAGLRLVETTCSVDDPFQVKNVIKESNELIAIFVASIRTASAKLQ